MVYPDQDGSSPRNWIRSGTAEESQDYASYGSKCQDPYIYNDFVGVDDAEVYEKVIEGSGHLRLVAAGDCAHQPVTAGEIGQIILMRFHRLLQMIMHR